eukprot:COSAG06_NODE_36081_length_452_cov_0.589235_1_plen_130_part_10
MYIYIYCHPDSVLHKYSRILYIFLTAGRPAASMHAAARREWSGQRAASFSTVTPGFTNMFGARLLTRRLRPIVVGVAAGAAAGGLWSRRSGAEPGSSGTWAFPSSASAEVSALSARSAGGGTKLQLASYN